MPRRGSLEVLGSTAKQKHDLSPERWLGRQAGAQPLVAKKERGPKLRAEVRTRARKRGRKWETAASDSERPWELAPGAAYSLVVPCAEYAFYLHVSTARSHVAKGPSTDISRQTAQNQRRSCLCHSKLGVNASVSEI